MYFFSADFKWNKHLFVLSESCLGLMSLCIGRNFRSATSHEHVSCCMGRWELMSTDVIVLVDEDQIYLGRMGGPIRVTKKLSTYIV